ncbi:calcium-activated chloride channel regulator 3A-1-like isoform X1 [Penaeus japonicus]|uniref:calcium-activated chloride channel regulator 3A-1-like isoform X1 n=2 Tax=Penaeus japonicus TaxID=27405 RepID=UPI001C712476|nr:calcium-activated chloride channel regulator 3A-1-like isoform X1 [Penaeus japonicus]
MSFRLGQQQQWQKRIKMKISLWVFLAMAATMEVGVIATMSKVRLVDNGYEGVVVGVSPRVPSSDAHRIVDSLKEMLKEGSKAMLKATRRRAFLRDVIILVPPSWQQVESDKLPNMLLRYEDSDIRVDMPNIIYQDQPYTLQSGQCGQPGQYIHYTPAYLTDDTMTKRWGLRGTSLVYEWAKLRWGVFEEIGFAGDPIYPAYYYSKPHGGSAVPTMCGPKYIAGDWKNGRGGNCTLTLNDVPQKHCSFEGRNCSSVSLMSMNVCPFAELEFCDAESHNSHAPTKHNELCGRKSIWEIMEGHRDFASGANPSLNHSAASDAPEPRVRVVRAGRPDVAMVIDTSGSMNLLRRYDRLKKAISQWFLLDAPEDITMALIKFSGTAEVLQNLTRLNTQEKKLAFISRLDLKPAGGTGIGNGLLKALQVLKNEKKLIYLVNDGEENTEPYVKDVMGDVLRSGATVITLGIGPRADPSLEELSMQTSGISFAIGDERYDFTIEDSLEAIHSFLPSHTERTMVR